jgi:hypothetical protein
MPFSLEDSSDEGRVHAALEANCITETVNVPMFVFENYLWANDMDLTSSQKYSRFIYYILRTSTSRKYSRIFQTN